MYFKISFYSTIGRLVVVLKPLSEPYIQPVRQLISKLVNKLVSKLVYHAKDKL